MKKLILLSTFFIIFCGALSISAQFNIKIPKIGKPKPEQPKTDEPKPDGDAAPKTPTASREQPRRSGEVDYMAQPQPTNVPVLLKDELQVRILTLKTYWKTPADTIHTSWLPMLRMNLFYDRSETVRYTVEWLKPDGTLWFSSQVDGNETNYSGQMDGKATDAPGVYGMRLLNSKTKEVAFQGKFKVGRTQLNPGEPRYKNLAMYTVDHDGNMPIGYVGFEEHTSWDYDPNPTVYLWFKGDLKEEDFEARLFHNGQQVTSTDDGGSIGQGARRNDDSCFQQTELCRYTLWSFTWNKFRVESYNFAATLAQGYSRQDPQATYTKDKPGEYTVKIFYKGAQVRETKFTVQPNGRLAANPYAAQLPMSNLKTVVPVKIMGTLDKWNPAAWKTDAFYGNPLPGFNVP